MSKQLIEGPSKSDLAFAELEKAFDELESDTEELESYVEAGNFEAAAEFLS